MLTFKVEAWSATLPEMRPFFPLLWEEVALDKDKIVAECDEEIYAILEQKQALHVVTARSEGKLVGFFVMTAYTHMHYKKIPIAFSDMYFLHPDYRKGNNGLRFLKFMENSLRGKVRKIYSSCKVEHDRTAIYLAMGWKKSDYVFSKYLGDLNEQS